MIKSTRKLELENQKMIELTQSCNVGEITTETEAESHTPTLAESVENAVVGYMNTMDDQQVTDLYELVLSEIEAPLLTCVLGITNNNQSQTAHILGLNRGTLRKKLKKYGML